MDAHYCLMGVTLAYDSCALQMKYCALAYDCRALQIDSCALRLNSCALAIVWLDIVDASRALCVVCRALVYDLHKFGGKTCF
ncbi:MAG: hypothetical protein WCJ03_10690 [Bacteroidales bacterium]